MQTHDNSRDSNTAKPLESTAINLPKGGGAIRGMGEKFQANPVTGSGSFSIPLPVSPGRGGFQPNISLAYDSGGGNGSFGLGWHIGTPSIRRRTDRFLPQYLDKSESDIFILAGAEDLVPLLDASGKHRSRQVTEQQNGQPVLYDVYPYRPRIEGLFARIERWWNTETRITHWRVISKDNITSIYGRSENARIHDPQQPLHIFEWFIEESHDDMGNRIIYEYKQENTDNLPEGLSEQQRIKHSSGFANKYLKRVFYSPFTGHPDRFHFQLLFDYGEHSNDTPTEDLPWSARLDPFSSYKSGFELRTYRLCRRVLMFHNFSATATDVWQPVKSLTLIYKETQALTYLSSATLTGYQPNGNGYDTRSLPPMEFDYTLPQPENVIKRVDPDSLANLPGGLDETNYQWIDLEGEGAPGIVTRQAGRIYYKENLGNAEFGPLKPVYTPVALAENQPLQLIDVDGDGVNELVLHDGTLNGFYRYADENWQPFETFKDNPVIDWHDPNLKMLDLSGDGRPDILITENELFRWYPSEGADGFGPSRTVPTPKEEVNGPKVLFADPDQSIYIADMSGDGLTDIVRIRNGEVCYWPNLGHGRFGAKVFMRNAPKFVETEEQFNPHYLKLGDIDGSGTTDIMYLGNGRPKYYANQAGNGWSEVNTVSSFMPVDSLSSVAMVDLLGKGTMCLVWSTNIPGRHEQQMSYVDLMGIKPHLLSEAKDNMGSITRLTYVPSSQFYIEDKKQGKPWISRLAFPVQCLARVETDDAISGNRFVTHYKYHHGHFDGVEREFRGFGMVEQLDTEEFATLNQGELPAASNLDTATNVPPVLTKTWFHTGIYMGRNHVSNYFAGLLNPTDVGEYYREPGLSDRQARERLLPDTIMPTGMTPEEEREASRSLKGHMLRQEVYALDGTDKQDIPYTVIEQNFTIEQLQREGVNRYGVFFTHPREAITYHYERNPVDPRTQHAMTLEVDEYGNVLKSLAIGYGRRASDLPDARDQIKQTTTLITYTDSSVTNAIDNTQLYPQDYRTPLAAETRTYELTGFIPGDNPLRFTFDEWTQNGFDWLTSATEIPYEQTADGFSRQKRLIEHVRSVYRRDDLTAFLPLGQLQPLALPGESYKLALTPGLIASVYQRQLPGQPVENLLPNPAAILEGKGADQGGYVNMDGNWWIPTGRHFFDPNADILNPANTAVQELATAQAHFYLPRKSTDPFDQSSLVDYDTYDLLMTRTVDALGNTVIADNDYRVLHPWQVTDPNRNRTAVAFDALGMVTATAVMGKDVENLGDQLVGFTPNPTLADLQAFIADPHGQAASLLGNATTRIIYDLDRFRRTGQPAFAATLVREIHFTDPGGSTSPIQVSFAYSDGFGREIQKKIQAEAGNAPQRQVPVLLPSGDIQPGELVRDANGNPVQANTLQRWVGTGRTVFNNKGKPVKQYEPFFSSTPLYESEKDMTDTGVSPILFYDPVERVIATLHPNHTYEKVVFDPWQQTAYDVNDTAAPRGSQTGDPRTDLDIIGYVSEYFKNQPDIWQTWYQQRIGNQMGAAEQDAAQKTAVHTDTPSVAHLDTLGRTFVTIAHNRYTRNGAETEEEIVTRIELDIEGNQRALHDAKDRLVMLYGYDILGNRIYHSNMENGERWILSDMSSKALRSWDSRNFLNRVTYDELRRPTGLYVTENSNIPAAIERLVGRTVYGESQGDGANHRARVYQVYDSAGIVTSVAYDFKGNLLTGQRDLLPDYKQTVDWSQNPAANDGQFVTNTSYDAFNRAVTATSPDGSVFRATFNEANLLDRVDVNLRGAATATPFVTNIDYDAKGRRERIVYANGAQTQYQYDPLTLLLADMTTTRPANQDATASQLFVNLGTVQDLHYTYDPVGNITRIEDRALITLFNNNQQIEPISRYTYDALYQLIEAQGREHVAQTAFDFNPPNGQYRDYPYIGNRASPNDLQALRNYLQQFEYDTTGNFQVMRHVATNGNWTRTYDYQEASLLEPGRMSNRLSGTVLGNGPNRIENYSHDIHGNITQMPHLPQMQWNFEDRLTQMALSTGNTAYYVYDSSGQRIRKVIERPDGTRQKERIYLGGYEIYREYATNGTTITLERESLHIMDGKQRIALVETRTQGTEPGIPAQLTRYQFNNHIGSASIELDTTGALIAYEEYHPYGTTAFQAGRSAAEVNLKRYRYTGKERDEESGFGYHGIRYYAAWLGRWTAADPAGTVDGPNLYTYTRNNPLVYSDPTGEASWGFWAGIAAATVVGVAATALTGGALGPVAAAVIGGMVAGATSEVVEATVDGKPITAGNVVKSAVIGGVTGGVFSKVGIALSRTGAAANVVERVANSRVAQAVSHVAKRLVSSNGAVRQTVRAVGRGVESLTKTGEAAGRRLGGRFAANAELQAAKRTGAAVELGSLEANLAKRAHARASSAAANKAASSTAARAVDNLIPDHNRVNVSDLGISKVDNSSVGYGVFGELDELGRPTGFVGTITPDMINTGTEANRSIIPPGFLGGGPGSPGHARGHLWGAQLGGSGDEVRNLVTLYQNPVNSPFMRDFETAVRKAVESGETVRYRVIPIYTGNNPMPTGVTLNARGTGGFRMDVSIENTVGENFTKRSWSLW